MGVESVRLGQVQVELVQLELAQLELGAASGDAL